MRSPSHFLFSLFFCATLLFITLAPCCALGEDLRAVYEQATGAYDRGDMAKAIELFTQAVKMAPKFAPAYIGLGLALRSNGADIEEVLYYYKTATDVDPSSAAAFEQLGRLYYSINKFDKAEDNFLKALKVSPGLASVKLSLGWLYLMARPNPARAAGYFKDVLKTDPSGNIWFGLGMAYFANNDRANAIDVITKLRDMKEEELAKKLESAMRENRKVVLEPLDQELREERPDTGTSDAAPAVVTPAAAVAPPNSPLQPKGIKVRLHEKLSVLDN